MRASLGIRRRAFTAIPHTVPLSVRYWRLYITGTNDTEGGGQNAYVTISEINFRPVVGTPVTMAPLGTPTASSTYATAGWEAPKACDGSASTAWICAQFQFNPSWWKFVYTNPVSIRQVALQSYPSAGGATQMVRLCSLQRSLTGADGTWVNTLTIPAQTGWSGAGETRLFNVP